MKPFLPNRNAEEHLRVEKTFLHQHQHHHAAATTTCIASHIQYDRMKPGPTGRPWRPISCDRAKQRPRIRSLSGAAAERVFPRWLTPLVIAKSATRERANLTLGWEHKRTEADESAVADHADSFTDAALRKVSHITPTRYLLNASTSLALRAPGTKRWRNGH